MNKVLIGVIGAIGVQSAVAETLPGTGEVSAKQGLSKETAKADEGGQSIETIKVTAKAIDSPTELNAFRLTSEDIQSRESGNGNLLDLLQANPSVQFSEDTNTSKSGGELTPGKISIHGAKFYENEILIDGMSNVNRLDAVSSNPNALDDTIGNPERMFIDTRMIESLSVYDNNIPARYGNFTGGVVDVDLKKSSKEPQGSVSFRMTQDKWAKYKLNPSDEEDFDTTTDQKETPFFKKQFYHLDYSTPINDQVGLVVSYDRKTSARPLYQGTELKDRDSISESLYLKVDWEGPDQAQGFISFNHSPHSSDYFINNIDNSGFRTEGGGNSLVGELSAPTKLGKYTVNANLTDSVLNRTTDLKHFHDYEVTASIPNEAGAWGDLEKSQRSFNLTQDLELEKFKLLGANHSISTGLELDVTQAKFARPNDVSNYKTYTVDNTVQCNGDAGCVEGEQYASQRNLYPSESVDVTANTYSFYMQDRIETGPLDVTAGLRLDYDDYFRNMNAAPRLAMSYKLDSDGNKRITAGANRYFAASPLTYKLREARTPYTAQTRGLNPDGTLQDWSGSTAASTTRYRFSDLDTPYTDELNLGYHHSLDSFDFSANYTHRKGKDQFARQRVTDPDGSRYYELNNNGGSESGTLAINFKNAEPVDLSWASMNWSLGITKNKRYSSHGTFDETLDLDDLDEYVIYGGDVIRKADRPADNYNRPWQASLITGFDFHNSGLTFTQTLNYKHGYRKYSDTRENRSTVLPDGSTQSLDVYELLEYDPSVITNWTVRYDQPVGEKESIYAKFEINNVFNVGREVGTSRTSSVEYAMGRQLWLEVGYVF